MEACRICGHYFTKSSTISIHDFNSHGLSYANMIVVLLNFKVVVDNNSPTRICFGCEQKLRECFEFRSLVQRAEMYLQDVLNKRILFNDVSDIANMVDIKTNPASDAGSKPILTWKFFEDGSEEIPYNDVVIKRIEPLNIKIEVDENFQDYDSDRNFDDGNATDYNQELDEMSLLDRVKKTKKRKWKKSKDDDSDEDYHVGMSVLPNNKKGKNKQKKETNLKGVHVNIKPTVIRNLKLVPPPQGPRKRRKQNTRKEKAEICPHCGILMKNLDYHLLTHSGEKKFSCEICGNRFYAAHTLKTHMNNTHSDIQLKCDNCVAVFKCKSSLMSHMKVHMPEKNYVCETCNKSFKRKNTLQRHAMTHNLANKKYKCDLCSMSFFCRGGLNHHMRIHTGYRPYKCEICSQPYSYKHDFNRHCLNKHGVFLKRRDVRVMNEEVLYKEKQLTQELINRINNINHNDEPINPFTGPQAALAFEMAVKQLIKENVVLTC